MILRFLIQHLLGYKTPIEIGLPHISQFNGGEVLIIRNDITYKVIVLGTVRINMHDIVLLGFECCFSHARFKGKIFLFGYI